MKGRMLGLALLAGFAIGAAGGELKREYFAATPTGAWAEYSMESADGSCSTTTSRRLPDQDGRVVIEEVLKVVAGGRSGKPSRRTPTSCRRTSTSPGTGWSTPCSRKR
ncbi:MAG: hypothetical protein U1F77_15200 [Kiritimatiellia bacterium]